MKRQISIALVLAMSATMLFAGCSNKGAATSSTASSTPASSTASTSSTAAAQTINVALPNNPICQALGKNTTNGEYKANGVTVKVAVLPENDLRQKELTEASTGGTTYDVFALGPYEAANWAKNGWELDLEPLFKTLSSDKTTAYDRKDIFAGMQDTLKYKNDAYALPFYGEGSFTMYNKDLFQQNGLTMPDRPTWDQIYQFATKINSPSKGITGITLRGQPGWGMSGAPIGMLVMAYGAQYYDMNWKATIDTAAMRNAYTMYKKLLRDAGQKNIIGYTYNECIALMQTGKCGIYIDATSIAPPLESKDSKIAGKVGYAMAPTEVKKSNTGWLWNWALAINPKISSDKQKAAFDYILWATSKDYINLTLQQDPTGASTPCAVRTSEYSLPAYQKLPYNAETLKALSEADFTKPSINPTPYVGLQYIGIPEWENLGDTETQNIAGYVTDKMSLDQAISKNQDYFNQIAKKGGYQK